MRRGPGLAGGRENCRSCSHPSVTHMFSFFTAVLPPNQKGQQTIQRAGSWTCWDDHVPVLTRVYPPRSSSFKLHAQWSIFSLFWLFPTPIKTWEEDAENPRAIHLNSSWEKYQAVSTIKSQSHILSYASKHRRKTQLWQCYYKNSSK